GDRELRPHDARDLEGLSIVGLEGFELPLDHLAQAIGYGGLQRSGAAAERPGPRLLGEETAAEREVDHVHQKQGMAVRAPVDQPADAVVDPATGETAAQVVANVGRGERRQLNLLAAAA